MGIFGKTQMEIANEAINKMRSEMTILLKSNKDSLDFALNMSGVAAHLCKELASGELNGERLVEFVEAIESAMENIKSAHESLAQNWQRLHQTYGVVTPGDLEEAAELLGPFAERLRDILRDIPEDERRLMAQMLREKHGDK